jgi:prepilin-type N-terminal cleavage/methylation domain-containing protein
MYTNLQRKNNRKRGFTLVEMIVAVALFAVVMLIAGATLLSLVYANRKAQALQSVMNNLDISLDGMVRSIRMGSNYRCGAAAPSQADCTAGAQSIYFTPYGADPSNRSEDWAYIYNPATGLLYKEENGGQPIAISAPEVSITSMKFYVVGTAPRDAVQPKVVMTVKGSAGVNDSKTVTTFNIQATAVERLLNL